MLEKKQQQNGIKMHYSFIQLIALHELTLHYKPVILLFDK